MCGRFALRISPLDLARQLDLPFAPDYQPRYNVAPTQMIPVVRAGSDRGREAVLMKWGLVPHWAKDPSIGSRMINARSETVHEKPAFRSAFASRRCLVPADGFYEWQPAPEGSDRKVKKQPHFIYPSEAHGSPVFAFAGLWERWRPDPDEEPIHTFTILTTAANDFMSPIHDRMPVILPKTEWGTWLEPGTSHPGELRELLRPYTDEKMSSYPVSTTVNNPRNDVAECITPL